MECLICQSKRVIREEGGYHYKESGLKNVVLHGLDIERCLDCGETTINIPRMSELHDTLAKHLISQESRLSPDQIVFLRKVLEWSGADLARHMHVNPATVSRWENGQREMSEPIDLLLRLAVAYHLRVHEFPLVDMVRFATKEALVRRFRAYNRGNAWEAEEAA